MSENKHVRYPATMSVATLLLVAAAFSAAAAGGHRGGSSPSATTKAVAAAPRPVEIPFPEAELYLELNNTDGDLGIHGSIDGDAWSLLTVEDPRERTILRLSAMGRLRQQGMTQLFFESAEPTFDELSPAEFFKRFPEGEYSIEAISLEGDILFGDVMLSHVMAAPPSHITLSGTPAARNCSDTLPVISGPVVIRWDPVVMSHPTIGRTGPVEIVRYQFFVEIDSTKLAVDLPPTVTEFEVPREILRLGNRFKFEIIARTATGNNTAVENCFLTR